MGTKTKAKEVPTPKKPAKKLKGGTESLTPIAIKSFPTVQEALNAYVGRYDDPLTKSSPHRETTLAEYGLKPEDVTEIGIKSALATQREAIQRNFEQYNRSPGRKPFLAVFGNNRPQASGVFVRTDHTTPIPAPTVPHSLKIAPGTTISAPSPRIVEETRDKAIATSRLARPKGKGVIATIIEVLESATKKKPATYAFIRDRLAKEFPDRPPAGMKSTVASQVPNGLWSEKKIKVQTDGRGGFWIEKKK